MSQGWIGVDLDGTLAHYEYGSHKSWSPTGVGAPIAPMVERVKRWIAEGREVRIFTARVHEDGRAGAPVGEVRAAIEAWCLEHIGVALPVTNLKDYNMIELYDDRAVQVEANTGRIVGHSTRGLV